MNIVRLNKNAYIQFREKEDISTDCKEFWYQDVGFIIKDSPFIIIEELFVPKEDRNIGIGTVLLKEVIRHNPDTIILVKSGLLVIEYPEEPTEEQFATVLSKLDDFYTNRGFEDFNKYSKTYENLGLYVYTGNEAGIKFLQEVKSYYCSE